ncbi:hypothetical protein [Rossellomorea sp. BNER]
MPRKKEKAEMTVRKEIMRAVKKGKSQNDGKKRDHVCREKAKKPK